RVGMLHRDLKPSNIMVERADDGSYLPCVLDFGLARDPRVASRAAHGTIVGTPNYMSPEQARGNNQELDRRSDVYSLRATLYAIVSARPPYQGTSAVEVVARVLAEPPAPLRSVTPRVPLDIEAIVNRAMARRPEDRYDTARALGADLRRHLDGDPVLARAPSVL